MICLFFFFFFSSRRRHTRYWRDWSSDVCSSDLSPTRSRRTTAMLGSSASPWPWPRPSWRSEERRVGKECRSRGSPYHYKKNRRGKNAFGKTGMDRIRLASAAEIDAQGEIARFRSLFFFQAEDGIRDIGVTGVQTCALPLVGAFLQNGEVAEHRLEIFCYGVGIAARVGAHAQILAHAQEREDFAAFGHVADAQPHDLVGVHALDLAALEGDRALLRVHDAADGFQYGRLAGAIGAQDSDDVALGHVEADAADRHDRTVVGLDVGGLEDGFGRGKRHGRQPPRYARMTSGWLWTSRGVPVAI